jgi:hypothetical protein
VEYKIDGCFRHRDCPWIFNSGEPFTNFTYDACFRIPQEFCFRKGVVQEDVTIVKRGVRGTRFGRRLGYLSIHELFAHSKKYQATKFALWYQKGKVEDV